MVRQDRMTKELFLLGMSVVYLFAFASIYIQIPGLYGENGILPVHLIVKNVPKTMNELIHDQPTLVRYAPSLGLSYQHAMELLALLGTLVSFLTLVHRNCRDVTAYTLLWVLYFSLYGVGQTFLWFQWDILLLEAGFLTILVAPLNLRFWKWQTSRYYQHDTITMFLVKWLLFRLMFASGIVKLTSECPTWWDLTAMDWHYESQCIPTPLSWYFHQLPHWFQAFSTVMVYVIEIILPFLFFSPIQGLRIFSFFTQILLMLLIIITGNYNFFNLLTIVLNISLLDDRYLDSFTRSKKQKPRYSELGTLGSKIRFVEYCISVVVYVALSWFTVKHFNLHLLKDWAGIGSKIGFTKTQFYNWLDWVLPITIWIGVAGLATNILRSLFRSCMEKGLLRKLTSVTGTFVFSLAAIGMFAISLVPHTMVSRNVQKNLWPSVKYYYQQAAPFEIVNSYGLFRRMTGVGGRPEVVIEGSDYHNKEWKEYEFLYKPTNVSRALPVVAPHQPRLDWQLWFAALGSYQNNAWFINLCYRLLQNQPEVIALIDRNPFPNQAPKYIKASLYTYHYTEMNPKGKHHSRTDWWWREFKSEYIPVLSLKEQTLIAYLKDAGLTNNRKPLPQNWISTFLEWLRSLVGAIEGCALCMSLLTTAVVVNRLMRMLNVS